METKLFKVVFSGRFKPDADEALAKQQLIKSLRLSDQQQKVLFSGRRVALKQCRDVETAKAFAERLSECGALVQILDPEGNVYANAPGLELVVEDDPPPVVVKPERPEQRKAPPPPVQTPQRLCPKCNTLQPAGNEQCVNCEIIFRKFERQQELESGNKDAEGYGERLKGLAAIRGRGWLKGKGLTLLVAAALLPIFGSSLVISSIFFSADKHVLYERVMGRKVCLDMLAILDGAVPSIRQDQKSALIQFQDYGMSDWTYAKAHPDEICVQKYILYLGHVGDESIEDLTIDFNEETLTTIFPDADPHLHMLDIVQNISAANERDNDPHITQDDGYDFHVSRLAPGTYVQIDFVGWFPDQREPASWDDLLNKIEMAEGKIEQGNPRATAIARALSFFF